MATKQLYKLYCKSERDVVTIWTDTPPTTCPNSLKHTIDLDSVRVSEKYNDVVIAAENSEGYFETELITMNIPSGTPGEVTNHDVIWVSDFLLWRTLITPTSDMVGDSITVVAAPETTIGVLTAPVSIGDTTFNVNSTVTDNMWRGFLVNLFDGVNKDFVDRCTNVNAGAGTITVQTPTVNAFAAGSAVQIGIYTLKDIFISNTNTIDIGLKGSKGKTITAGMALRVLYTNNSGTSKTIRWRAEGYNKG